MLDPMERVPPQNIDAERACLGALMQAGDDTGIVAEVTAVVEPESFYKMAHMFIFTACVDLAAADTPIDLVTVSQQLEKNGEMERVGGVPYLNDTIDSCPTSANAVYYAKIVREKAIRRYLVVKGAAMSQAACDDEVELDEVISDAEEAIMEVRAPEARKNLVHVKGVVNTAFKRVNAMYQNGDSLIGLSTGFPELDRKLSGLHDSQYIIIGGRPGMGKSGFIQNIIYNVGVKQGEGAVLFSLETSAEAFVMRLLSQGSRIDLASLKSGHLSDSQFAPLAVAAGEITGAPIWIDSTGGIKPSQIRQRLRQVQRDMEIKLILIDYLQLMQSDSKTESRVDKLAEISAGVKALAQDFGCPLIAVSQLSRRVEERPDKRPKLHDLRESGSLEQDADLVWFVYRHGEYQAGFDPKRTELIVAKNKDGPVGTLQFEFDMQKMTFKEAAW